MILVVFQKKIFAYFDSDHFTLFKNVALGSLSVFLVRNFHFHSCIRTYSPVTATYSCQLLKVSFKFLVSGIIDIFESSKNSFLYNSNNSNSFFQIFFENTIKFSTKRENTRDTWTIKLFNF